MEIKNRIARRVAQELHDGDIVNLGAGLPTLVAQYLPDNIDVLFHSENGILGLCDNSFGIQDPDLTNAAGQPCSIIQGGATFDSAFSFALIRGGHLDACILGGLEVDQHGNFANWMIPEKMKPGMGGAMDLVAGTKNVIVAMEHCTKAGKAKIVRQCQFPLTAEKCVSTIVTELAVFRFIDGQLTLVEHAADTDIETIKVCTEAEFVVADELRKIP
ncbi:3-oxoacid CoA-transferase subunit B [Providencia rettgeri]|uniref:3-oxoacid CoA-transferase subunit B n=1 Tax=Providencia rettgeri TaxID=587 RepID=UPI00235F5D31|nr:3-oxoacid CoA-transferase subunit B [Providencia rettgeri]MDR2224729.1 3-oxoacid CoA-transferase subunit B [Providencia sp.]